VKVVKRDECMIDYVCVESGDRGITNQRRVEDEKCF